VASVGCAGKHDPDPGFILFQFFKSVYSCEVYEVCCVDFSVVVHVAVEDYCEAAVLIVKVLPSDTSRISTLTVGCCTR